MEIVKKIFQKKSRFKAYLGLKPEFSNYNLFKKGFELFKGDILNNDLTCG